MWIPVLLLLVGLVLLIKGGDWFVDGASALATRFGIPQLVIGLTIVALGTSLPELVTSFVAARNGEVDMALGNAIGSNVFNILLVLGIASFISPIAFMMSNAIDIAAVIVATIVCWAVAAKNKSLGKIMGVIMVVSYFAYMVYVVMRETGALM